MPIGCSVEKSKSVKATTEPGGVRRQLAWFVLLWLLSIGALGLGAWGLRWIMSAVYGG